MYHRKNRAVWFIKPCFPMLSPLPLLIRLNKRYLTWFEKFGAASKVIYYSHYQFCDTFDVSILVCLYLPQYLSDYIIWQSSVRLLSLLPVLQTEEAICITVLRGNLLTILVDIPSNSGYV